MLTKTLLSQRLNFFNKLHQDKSSIIRRFWLHYSEKGKDCENEHNLLSCLSYS